jgi:hypothetical protein
MVRESRSTHHKALETLSRHPEIIGISPKRVMTSTIEPVLFDKGNFYAEPDVVFELVNKKVVIIEYKSNGHIRLIEDAENQLEKAVDFYQKRKKVPTEGRIITGFSYPCLVNKHLLQKKDQPKISPHKYSTKINRALKILGNSPKIIGIEPKEVVTFSINQLLFYRGNVYEKASLVFDLKNGDSIIVEYEPNSHRMHLEDSGNRLERAVDFYQKIKGVHVEGRMITGSLHPKLINCKSSRGKSKKSEPKRRHSKPTSQTY